MDKDRGLGDKSVRRIKLQSSSLGDQSSYFSIANGTPLRRLFSHGEHSSISVTDLSDDISKFEGFDFPAEFGPRPGPVVIRGGEQRYHQWRCSGKSKMFTSRWFNWWFSRDSFLASESMESMVQVHNTHDGRTPHDSRFDVSSALSGVNMISRPRPQRFLI